MSTGALRKMRTTPERPVEYRLPVGDALVDLKPRIGETISMSFDGRIECANCGRVTKKSYSQGHCFPCSQRLAACDLCVLQPSRCHYDAGTCREPGWGETHCMQKHFVYLANTSGLKVGITRAGQTMTRWMDQGASQALPIFAASTRQVSGLVEAALARHVSDRTDWRALLRGSPEPLDLGAERDRLIARCQEEIGEILQRFGPDSIVPLPEAQAVEIEFPVLEYPEKIKSLSFDRMPRIEGRIHGIKGQYLLLDDGVLNVRKFRSYIVTVDD